MHVLTKIKSNVDDVFLISWIQENMVVVKVGFLHLNAFLFYNIFDKKKIEFERFYWLKHFPDAN